MKTWIAALVCMLCILSSAAALPRVAMPVEIPTDLDRSLAGSIARAIGEQLARSGSYEIASAELVAGSLQQIGLDPSGGLSRESLAKARAQLSSGLGVGLVAFARLSQLLTDYYLSARLIDCTSGKVSSQVCYHRRFSTVNTVLTRPDWIGDLVGFTGETLAAGKDMVREASQHFRTGDREETRQWCALLGELGGVDAVENDLIAIVNKRKTAASGSVVGAIRALGGARSGKAAQPLLAALRAEPADSTLRPFLVGALGASENRQCRFSSRS